MQYREDSLVALLVAPVDEISAEMRAATEAADDGLRLISAFIRIRDPALRATAVHFVSELAKRSEQASVSAGPPANHTPERTLAANGFGVAGAPSDVSRRASLFFWTCKIAMLSK